MFDSIEVGQTPNHFLVAAFTNDNLQSIDSPVVLYFKIKLYRAFNNLN